MRSIRTTSSTRDRKQRATRGKRQMIHQAHTLIEITIVAAIIVALALSMIWIFSDNAEEKVEIDKRKMELIRQKIESYQVKHDAYPTKILLSNANGS